MKISFKNWRANTILLIIIIFGAAIIGRLFFLQVLEHKLLQAQAMGQQVGFSNTIGSRGAIYCQSEDQKKSLAINKDSWTLSVTVKDILNKEKFAEILGKNISLSKEQILTQLNSGDDYPILEKDLSTQQLAKIKKLNLKGLSWVNSPDRFYPQGNFASQVLGFLGGSGTGQYGVEGYYNDVLQGKAGVLQQGAGLNAIMENYEQDSLDGSDAYLTIDYNIQLQAEALLKKAQEKYSIDSGQIIVMDPKTGKIFALANSPTFDPNLYSKEKDLGVFQNGATQKLFEPGSIMKPFTMAVVINEGKITPNTSYVDSGYVKIGPETIHNFDDEKYGTQTMTQVLENSINTGAVFAEQQIPHKTFWDYITKLGFAQKTGVDLQGETYSKNEALKNGHDVEYATASFGQGIEITPLQIARAYCALANGGKLVKPYIVDKVLNNGQETYSEPEFSNQIFSQNTLAQVNSMLISVVDNGFNKVAKIPGYYFAGKTGTAQIPLPNGRGYMPDNNTIQSFVGYGPVYNPKFLILVKLDNPKVSKSALSAVPIYKELANYLINYWKIPPDYDPQK